MRKNGQPVDILQGKPCLSLLVLCINRIIKEIILKLLILLFLASPIASILLN